MAGVVATVLGVGRMVYHYAPLPARWKDAVLAQIYRWRGDDFAGERHYELWLRRHAGQAAHGAAGPLQAGCPGRDVVLVVDRHIPQPDRDAGSRSIWCVLRALKAMGLHVVFWPHDGLHDPAYSRLLHAEGVEVLEGEQFRHRFKTWIRANGHRIDYALLSRPLVARDFLPLIRKHTAAKVLFYGVDLHYLRLLQESATTGRLAQRWEAAYLRRLEQTLWRQMDVIYYPSQSETDTVLSLVPNARAQTLPLFFFEGGPPRAVTPAGRTGVLFVAGFAHAPNVDAAIWLVQEIMPLVWAHSPTAHLWLVGSNPTDDVRRLGGPQVTVTGYVTDQQLTEFYGRARAAIVPLRIGAGMKGKVVEALYYGLPLATTSVGAQGLPGLDSVISVADAAEALAQEVARVLTDDAHWLDVSRHSQAYAAERFSAQAMESVLRRDIDVAARPPAMG